MIKYQPFLTSVESGTKHYNSPFFLPRKCVKIKMVIRF